MAGPVYATATDLNAYLGGDQAIDYGMDTARVLDRASRAVDRLVTARYTIDADRAPTKAEVILAMQEATCATIEYWLQAGESVDVMAVGGPISFGGLSMRSAPNRVAPRAAEILRLAGLRGEPGAPGYPTSESASSR